MLLETRATLQLRHIVHIRGLDAAQQCIRLRYAARCRMARSAACRHVARCLPCQPLLPVIQLVQVAAKLHVLRLRAAHGPARRRRRNGILLAFQLLQVLQERVGQRRLSRTV